MLGGGALSYFLMLACTTHYFATTFFGRCLDLSTFVGLAGWLAGFLSFFLLLCIYSYLKSLKSNQVNQIMHAI